MGRLLIKAAADLDLDDETRLFALRALGRWYDPRNSMRSWVIIVPWKHRILN